jgi:3-phosphoshikimate 1-carboxyvinyltransferase
MPLPDLIEIVPLAAPVRAEITVPGSKSITNRALVLAALAEGETILRGALWSEDTQMMVECLQELGFMVNVGPDPAEPCNRTITVYGQGGQVLRGGTEENPLELFVGNAGTAARFLAAMACLGSGAYRLHGVPRMHERPQAALFHALRELGYRINSPNDKLPAVVHGGGPRPGKCTVSIAESSQFASALLLGARTGRWEVSITGENAEESPYVALTSKLVEAFPNAGGSFHIEPDCSSGSYFWAAGWLSAVPRILRQGNTFVIPDHVGTYFVRRIEKDGSTTETDMPVELKTVKVRRWPSSGWQIDAMFPELLPLPKRISRERQLGDSIMTAMVLAADWDAARTWRGRSMKPSSIRDRGSRLRKRTFSELGRLRIQECDRVAALRTELTKCGAGVIEKGDTLVITPGDLHGAEIETCNDHRMAMCFAILGLKVPGIKIKNPACVKKTFPDFFQKLAAPPPHGLGAEFRDAATGRRLGVDELFAE